MRYVSPKPSVRFISMHGVGDGPPAAAIAPVDRLRHQRAEPRVSCRTICIACGHCRLEIGIFRRDGGWHQSGQSPAIDPGDQLR